MDFFTNLLHLPINATTRNGRSLPLIYTQQEVLSEMELNWQAIQVSLAYYTGYTIQSYYKDTLNRPDERQLLRGIQSTEVPKRLSRIVDTLVLETGKYQDIEESPPALDWFLSQDILSKLVNLSAADRPVGIKTEVLKAVSNLCVTMQSHFFVQAPVHKPLVQLLKICTGDNTPNIETSRVLGAASTAATSQPSEYEEHLVDLLCILCNKIKSSPSLLHIFFMDRSWIRYPTRNRRESHEDRPTSPTSMSTVTSRAEFLLFTYLLRWVHREGRTGDLARAAILLLFEVSTSDNINETEASNIELSSSVDIKAAVAEFIVDGDLAEVLAAGLGAVYGILPTNLAVIPTDPQDKEQKSRSNIVNRLGLVASVELSTSIAFQNQLWVFMSVFEFTAEIIKRGLRSNNKYGIAIAENILASVNDTFFGSVLYPSILECSSMDYSAVAVTTYLEVMLASLNSGPLSEALLDYLLADDDDNKAKEVSDEKPTKKHERRRSTALVLLQSENAAKAKGSSEYFSSLGRFTLKDLITINLRSTNDATAVSTVKLFSQLAYLFDEICLPKLMSIIPKKDATAFPYFHQLHNLMKDYRKREINGKQEGFNEDLLPIPPPMRNVEVNEDELTNYLMLIGSIDAHTTQEMLSTGYERYLDDAQAVIMLHPQYKLATDTENDEPFQAQHKFDLNDKTMNLILDSLRNFFVQSPEMNVSLSGALASLASNPRRSLEGFMTKDWVDEDDPGYDESRPRPDNSLPIVLTIIQDLVDQIDDYRLQAKNNITSQDFDFCLRERRRGMLFKENLEDALALLGDVEPAQRNELVKQFEEGVGRGVLKSRNKRRNQQKKKDYGEIGRISHKRYQDSIDTEFEKRVERNNSWGISNLTAKADKFINKPKTRSATSSLAALFTSNRKKSQSNEVHQQKRQVSAFEGPATPFYDHYRQTEQCLIIPKVTGSTNSKLEDDHMDSIPEDDDKENRADSRDTLLEKVEEIKPVTLSHLLENVVILEEMLKE
ncbi:hypothetical protein E3Q05_02242 [Wallemia mellicola]|nr:hypothetical protein E3Q05_02242 [Wallemia mellicola]